MEKLIAEMGFSNLGVGCTCVVVLSNARERQWLLSQL